MMLQISAVESSLQSLQSRWLAVVTAAAALHVLGYLGIVSGLSAQAAGRWLIISAILSGLALVNVRQNLVKNHAPDGAEIIPVFGAATLLTILRAVLISMLAGFLFEPWPAGWLRWVPGLIYWISNLTDLFDGYVARRTGSVTALGGYLDMQFDGLAVLVGSLLAVQYGQVPILFVFAAFARYLFVLGERFRKARGLPVHDLTPSVRRRAVAGVFMSMVGTLLLPVFSPPGTHVASYGFLAVFLTGFAFDWLVVSGGLGPAQAARLSATASRLAASGALILRIGLVIAVGLTLSASPPSLKTISAASMWSLALILVLVSYFFGIAGRATALIHLVLLGFMQNMSPLSLLDLAAAGGAALLFFTGTGKASLWSPEETLLSGGSGEMA